MYYKLAPSRSSNLSVDEVIYAKDSETGEPKSISVNQAADLTDDEAGKLRGQGFVLLESSAPDSEEVSGPVVGDDIRGTSPTFQTFTSNVGNVTQTDEEEETQDQPQNENL